MVAVLLADSSAFLQPSAKRECPIVLKSKQRDSLGEAWQRGIEHAKTMARRFTSPTIDDQGLVYADAMLAGIVAPGLEAIACIVLHQPLPNWATALGPRRLVAPVLLRGFNLGGCWLGGALSARLYERSAFDFPPPAGASNRYAVTLSRVFKAGCFATALLIVSTQLAVVVTMGPDTRFGNDPQIDGQLLRLIDDLLHDVATEALVLSSWRVGRTYLSKLDA